MNDEIKMYISVPADDSGYVLLKCSHCGALFKATPEDIEDEGILQLYCPSCGLISDSYLPDDVLELALAMARNRAMDLLDSEFKKMEREFKRGPIVFQAERRSKREPETPIRVGIDDLKITYFSCCNRRAKIKPLLKITGCYCPFCGVKNYEVE